MQLADTPSLRILALHRVRPKSIILPVACRLHVSGSGELELPEKGWKNALKKLSSFYFDDMILRISQMPGCFASLQQLKYVKIKIDKWGSDARHVSLEAIAMCRGCTLLAK